MTALQVLARRRIKEGDLPCLKGLPLAGYDGVEPCALCDGKIEAGEIVYEIPCVHPRTKALHFHSACHEAWKAECARIPQQSRSEDRVA